MGVVESKAVATIGDHVAGGVRPTRSANEDRFRAMGETGAPSIAATDGGEH